jgi:thiol-disulfide isomerase/thioredoxin
MIKPSFTSLRLSAFAICIAAGTSMFLTHGIAAEQAQSPAKPATEAVKPEAAANGEEAAWDTLSQLLKQPPTPPAEWRTQRPTEAERKAFILKHVEMVLAKVSDFLGKYPNGTNASKARMVQIQLLQTAVMAGSKERETELAQLLSKTAKDTNLPDDERAAARLTQLNLEAMKAKSADESSTIGFVVDGMIAIQKDFPKSELVYGEMAQLLTAGSDPSLKRVAKVLAESPDAPAKIKQMAQDMISGKTFSALFAVGKPVGIKFTATDGTEVDLAKMKGKVVLVDFWATWCGPCVGEIPHVKDAYAQYHEKGFEIVGISFDKEGDQEKLTKFTKDKGMTWPQYFDGKYWNNDFGKKFGIHSIPAMWLIDKNGNLADANAREDLTGKVAKLLEAK